MKSRIKDDGSVECTRDGVTVTKQLLGVGIKCADLDTLNNAAAYMALKRAIEADRDMAFERYGDDWREHCEFPPGSDSWDMSDVAETFIDA